jgi:phosphatidylcholine synthase
MSGQFLQLRHDVATGKLLAAGIHVLTASGVVAGFFALLAVISQRWEAAFTWLAVAAVIDGIDGPLARYFQVKKRMPRFSGERLDLVIDYFTYVVVPALMIFTGGQMSKGWALIAAVIVLMSSLFHFSDMGSKTEDGFFVGFPAIWNVVAFYLFAFPMPSGAAFALIAFLGAMTFVPLKWVHPVRVERWRVLTIIVLTLWSGASALALWQGLPASPTLQIILVLCGLYLLACGLMRSFGRD